VDRDLHSPDIGTIGALLDGRPQRQFEDIWATVIAAVLDPEAARSGGLAKGQITVTLTIEGTSETDGGLVTLGVEISGKVPKRRATAAPLVALPGGVYALDLTDPQQRIEFPPPAVVNGRKE